MRRKAGGWLPLEVLRIEDSLLPQAAAKRKSGEQKPAEKQRSESKQVHQDCTSRACVTFFADSSASTIVCFLLSMLGDCARKRNDSSINAGIYIRNSQQGPLCVLHLRCSRRREQLFRVRYAALPPPLTRCGAHRRAAAAAAAAPAAPRQRRVLCRWHEKGRLLTESTAGILKKIPAQMA